MEVGVNNKKLIHLNPTSQLIVMYGIHSTVSATLCAKYYYKIKAFE